MVNAIRTAGGAVENCHVVGARPNFMKVAPLMAEMARHPGCIEQVLVHSGQHYERQHVGCTSPISVCRSPTCIWASGCGKAKTSDMLASSRCGPHLLRSSQDGGPFGHQWCHLHKNSERPKDHMQDLQLLLRRAFCIDHSLVRSQLFATIAANGAPLAPCTPLQPVVRARGAIFQRQR